MIAQTSLEAWIRLQSAGRVNPNQLIILDVFKAANGMALSNYDVSVMLGWPINRVTPRVNELKKKGKLVTVWTKTQLQTGRTVNTYCLAEDALINPYLDGGVLPRSIGTPDKCDPSFPHHQDNYSHNLTEMK